MATSARQNPGLLQQRSLERELFIVLIHLYTLGEELPDASWDAERIMRDLGFTPTRMELVLSALVNAGLLSLDPAGAGFALTPRAITYLEVGAGRRRSVRSPA